VPATAKGPLLNVGRPDKLTVTVGGQTIPPLGDGSRAIKDVPLDPAAIAARMSGAPAATSSPPVTPRTPLRERPVRRSSAANTGEANGTTAPTAAPPPPAATTPADQ